EKRRQKRRQRRRTSAAASSSEPANVVQYVPDEKIPPDDEREHGGQQRAGAGVLGCEWLPPEVPVCRKYPQTDRDEMLLQLERTDLRPQTHLLDHDSRLEPVLPVDDAAEREREQVQNDDRVTERKRPTNEPAGLRAGAQTLTVWCVMAPRSATASRPWTMSSTVVVFIDSQRPPRLQVAGHRPPVAALSVERLDLDDGGAVVAADPERDRRRRVVDEHPADVGRPRQQIFHELPVPGVEPHDAVRQHGG